MFLFWSSICPLFKSLTTFNTIYDYNKTTLNTIYYYNHVQRLILCLKKISPNCKKNILKKSLKKGLSQMQSIKSYNFFTVLFLHVPSPLPLRCRPAVTVSGKQLLTLCLGWAFTAGDTMCTAASLTCCDQSVCQDTNALSASRVSKEAYKAARCLLSLMVSSQHRMHRRCDADRH